MKFGKQLQLGMYEPWKPYYIQYNRLKRIIQRKKFLIDKLHSKSSQDFEVEYVPMKPLNRSSLDLVSLEQQHKAITINSSNSNKPAKAMSTVSSFSSLNSYQTESTTVQYTPAYLPTDNPGIALLSMPSNKINYTAIKQNHDDINNNEDFFNLIKEEMNKINSFYTKKINECKTTLSELIVRRNNSYISHHSSSSSSNDLSKLRDLYVELKTLREYCELNQTGFYKIIKKYDKILNENTLDHWLIEIDNQIFVTSTDTIDTMELLTSLVSRDKLIEWEIFFKNASNRNIYDVFPSVKISSLFISICIFIISLNINIISTLNDDKAKRCLSILLLAISLWVTEAIPYYATSIFLPVLVVVLDVLKDPQTGLSMRREVAATFVLNNVFNHTTMLLLGGYTISTAFSRCQLELRVASYFQEKLGNRPKLFILAIMFLGLFLSMWISNHTAPILCATIILPIVKDLPTESKFSKTLLLGLAFGCNFGGMMTPISSLQNVIAVSSIQQATGIEVSFGRWLCVSIPFCSFCIIVSWIILITIMDPTDIIMIPAIVYEQNVNIFNKRNVTVIVMSGLTILFFATSTLTKGIFGDIEVISLIFVGFMFGSGILTEVDFNSLSWHTLFLVGGGNILGKAVESSGLLTFIASNISEALPLNSPWLSLMYVLLFATTVATFVSHTVAALILLPLISRLGVTLDIPEVMVVGSAFAISAAMALPFSSFPNVNSLLIVDDFQTQYLSVKDFIITGAPLTIMTIVLVATVGYTLISAILVV